MSKPTVESVHDELERVKKLITNHLNIDFTTDEQRAQAVKDGEAAAKAAAKANDAP